MSRSRLTDAMAQDGQAADMTISISLLVDDCAPVNTMFWSDAAHEHAFLMPNALARDFGDLCARYGVRGKFSVLPMPCCLGGIDGKLSHVPPRHLADFLAIVRKKIAPRFDITPEILTHFSAYRLTGGFHHLHEDEWIARATVPEMTDYIALALQILDHVGLPANGVTSPWVTGNRNEGLYAEAIAAAQWRVHRRRLSWYFLHMLGSGPARWPWVSWRNRKRGQIVVSVPSTTDDPFWCTQRPMSGTRRVARAAARAGVEALLTRDGKAGRIRELVDQDAPVLILTHWQSLFSDGTFAGLEGLAMLLERVNRRFGAGLAWTTCSDLAAQAVASPRTRT